MRRIASRLSVGTWVLLKCQLVLSATYIPYSPTVPCLLHRQPAQKYTCIRLIYRNIAIVTKLGNSLSYIRNYLTVSRD
ncbi:hypothetical protein F4815DRAFT_451025 [Daldinia loculata]|nr:hypothetical protein F4815DRAFT_451025 [Daldinia loculata]